MAINQDEGTLTKVFTVPLRPGTTWHDGTAFTAEDVRFSVDCDKQYKISDSAPEVTDVDSDRAAGHLHAGCVHPSWHREQPAHAGRRAEPGRAFLTHDLGEAVQVCDRIVVLKDGVVVDSGPRRPW